MTTVNYEVGFQNRSGDVLSTVSLEAFWGALIPTGTDDSDSRVTDASVSYDPYTNKYLFSTLTYLKSTGENYLLIAVSQSSDPTGAWNKFRLPLPAGADQPKLGFNQRWVGVSINFPLPTATNYASVVLIDRPSMSTTTLITKKFDLPHTSRLSLVPAVTYDSTLAELYLVQTAVNESLTRNGNALNIYRISGSGTSSAVLSSIGSVAAGNAWQHGPVRAPQVYTDGSAVYNMDTGDDRIINCVYRGGSVWAAHTIFLPAATSESGPTATISAAQWWQVSVPTVGVQQHGIIGAVGDAYFRAFPSISVNKNTAAVIGYSRFNGGMHPHTAYSYRTASDAAGAMRAEAIGKLGEERYHYDAVSPYRWADYSATVVDPVNDLDLWTIQVYPIPYSQTAAKWATWWNRISVFRRMEGGLQHGLAEIGFGDFAASGQNIYGQLGNGNTVSRNTATGIFSQSVDIAAGDYCSLSVNANGTLSTWGNNQYGQLGNGTVGGTVLQPTQIASTFGGFGMRTQTGDGKHTIASSFAHSVALDTAGQVWTWGTNYDGQLGDGTTMPHYSPG